ncbi:MAG: PilC/PilY family type IV pilus protein, partial [Pseudomonadales bacterium]
MNSKSHLSLRAKRWLKPTRFLLGLAFLACGNQAFATNDSYSIDEDSLLSVAAPGVLLNDILLGSVTAVNVTPTTDPDTPGTRTFPGTLGGLGRPLEMSSDGSFTYDPRGRFDFLSAGETFNDFSTNADNATTRYINPSLLTGGTIRKVFITVTGVNDVPTDLTLSANTLNENAGANFVIGSFTTTDVDQSDTHTYSLVGGTGSTDNALFNISGANLRATNSLDYENKSSYSIRVRTDDGEGGTLDRVFTIDVNDLNDTAPIFTNANNLNVNENTTAVVTVATTDPDTIGTNPATLTIAGGTDQDDFDLTGNALTFSSAPDFEAPADSNGDNVYVVDIRAFDGVNQSFQTITVTVQPVADPVATFNVTPNAAGNEDTAIGLGISATLTDTDGSETLSYQITNVPTGASFNAGSDAGGGTWNFAAGDVAGLTITPPAHDDSNFTLSVTAIATETLNGDTQTTAAAPISVTVTAVADPVATFNVTPTAAGDEDAAIALNISASLTDTDGSEVLTYQITGVPTGASLSAGTNAGGGTWNLSAADVAGLTVTSPEHDDSNFNLSVTATATENANGDFQTTAPTAIAVTVTAVADTPNLSVNAASGDEDTAIALTINGSLVDTDGSETLTYQITGVPAGVTLNNGVDAGGGVWNLSVADITGLQANLVANDDTNFTLGVTATATEADNGDTATTAVNNLAVTVNAVADTPTVTVTGTAATNEDTPVALTISGALTDLDGSETLGFRISNVPIGASLNNGTNAGGGVWNLTAADVTGLQLTPKLHDDSDFTLNVVSVATEGANGDAADSVTANIAVTVTAVVDTPNFAVANMSGNEDVAITVGLTTSLVDNDGSEVLTAQITNVPTGVTFNNGTNAGGGVWNFTEADLSGLTLTNKLHDDSDFTINASVTATDNDASSVTLGPSAITVTITAVADAPVITVTNTVTRDEDDNPWPLTIAGDLVDTDGSETMTYQISGVISAATLSAGTNNGGGVWTLTEAEAETGLTLTMDAHVATDFQIDVRALATEARDGSTEFSAPGSGRININVTDKADNVTLNVTSPASGNEDTPIPLTISGELVDVDGSETLTMYITGQPAGSTFSAGSDLGGGRWGVDGGDLAGLTISAAANNNDDFTLTITATAEETENGDKKETTDTIDVQIQAVNDAPSLAPATLDIDENSGNGTVVGTVTATDVEPVGSETAQSLTYEIEGTAFAIDNSGQITVADVDQLDFETTPQFNLDVTVRDNGLPSLEATATITIDINNLNDNRPEAVDDVASVDELETVNFNVISNDIDSDGSLDNLEVYEVDGDIGLVGVPVDLEVDGIIVGTITINTDGSTTFVATPDNTVEKFEASIPYKTTDGTNVSDDAGDVTININPINDNAPTLSAAGAALASGGVNFDEDQFPSQGTAFTVIVNNLFVDLDIDADGLLDSNTAEDNDSLVFAVEANTDPGVLEFNLDSGDLSLWSLQDVHGVSTITLSATDTADPSGNISTVELDIVVTVNSINDAPTYQFGSFSNSEIDEDSGDVFINLAGAFTDADLNDSTPGDDVITYTITVIDTPNEFVLTPMIDETGLNVVSDDTPPDAPRTLVVETTDPTITLDIFQDAHGLIEVTVRATDAGRPPESPADPLPLFDEESFRVTVNGIGDDQPTAEDDHYNDIVELTINEDSEPLFFDVLTNDYQGDVPAKVVIVGQTIVDSSGAQQALVSSTRLADPDDTGDFSIEVNGEVSCAFFDCLDAQRGVVSIDGSGIADSEIVYKPRLNFNGEDSFTYCIEDSASAGDPQTCATVTVNVLPVNDKPVVDESVLFTMDQADDLIVEEADGLKNFVRDLDNTHIDGLGCDPLEPSCTPGPSDPQPDRLYFYFDSVLTAEGGQLFPPFLDDGSFNYRPSVEFTGSDSFTFQVCDLPSPGDPDHCAPGTVLIQIEPLEGAPEGSSDSAVQFDYQLAQTPLELPIGPEPNVLVVNDDSGSMAWDIMSEGSSGLYQVSTGHSLYYVNKATAGSDTYIAPAESVAPNQGLWRLRNSEFNTVYYNPEIRYEPWEGLDFGDNPFPDSPPTAARHNPLSGANTTNLTQTIDFTGRAVNNQPRVCTQQCRRFRRGRCVSYRTVCTGGTNRFEQIETRNFYIPRYYKWTDLNGNEALDATPSPANEAASCATNRVLGCSEGELVEIRNTGELYPRGAKRTDCQTTASGCTYEEEIQNFANWFTYYRSREFTAKAALGVVIAKAQNLRLGYAKLNSERNILPVESMNTSERTGAKAAMLDAVYATNSSGGTPLRRSLRDAGRYFECKANDIFDSNSETSAGNSACPILPAPDGNCQQNFTLLITDGTWNGSSPSTGNSDGDNNTNFDGGAFAGSNFTTLADVAMLYYERDLHPDLNNEVPTTSRDRALAAEDAFENGGNEIMHQHMTTYTVGFGVKGLVEAEPENFQTGFNWGNPFSSDLRKTDDVRHAAYNGRGEYLDASNAANLAEELTEAFEEFSQGSGAASAVSFNSQEIQEDTLIFRAFYNTKINTGDLLAQRLTPTGLEEEPVWNSAKALDDQPADTREIITYDEVTNQGIPFRPANLNTAQRDSFISNPGASEAQKNAEVVQRVNYLRGDASNERPVGNFRERPAVEGRLGDIVHSTPVFVGGPNRPDRDGGEYPAERYADFKADNFDRTEVIYVASNDGMLHGFNAEDGSEVFGYVPNNLMLNPFSRNITELLNFEYEHKFFVDITPAANDVYMDADEDGDKDWETLLIGGHGAGAKAYFALRVTDPTKLNEANASDVVMWEFTEEDDTYPTDSSGSPLLTSDSQQRQDLQDTPQPVKDLGYSFSVPTIAMSNHKDTDGENEWVAMFGNGYNSTSGIAKLFVLFVDRGVDGNWCHPDMIHNETLNGPMPA